jgi:hypothetical protein
MWELVHLVGFIIGVYHDARSSECQKSLNVNTEIQVRSKGATLYDFWYRNVNSVYSYIQKTEHFYRCILRDKSTGFETSNTILGRTFQMWWKKFSSWGAEKKSMNLLREEKSYNPPQIIKPALKVNFRTSVGFSADLFSSFHCNIPARLQQTCTSKFLIIKFLLLCRFCLHEERSKKYHLKSLFLTLYFPPPPSLTGLLIQAF